MDKILIIDDSLLLQRVLKEILEEKYEVYFVKTGQEAFSLLESEPISLVFSDLRMPSMTGFEFLQKKNEMNSEVPVVILSSDTRPESLKRALELGARSYLKKPPDKNQILSLVESILKERGSH